MQTPDASSTGVVSTTRSDLRIRLHPGLARACGAIAIGAMLLPAAGSAGTSKPSLSEQLIIGIALNAGAANGDRRPSLIQHVQATRHRANLIAGGDIVPGSNWCYLIAERGRFVAKDASYPAGGHPPKGSVITLVVDARTGDVLDFGLSDRYPRLRKLGAVHTDLS